MTRAKDSPNPAPTAPARERVRSNNQETNGQSASQSQDSRDFAVQWHSL